MEDQTPNPTRYPITPTKPYGQKWFESFTKHRDAIVDQDGTITAGKQTFAFEDADRQLAPGSQIRVYYKGNKHTFCITREDALSEDQYWIDLELARIAAEKAKIRQHKAGVWAFNTSIDLPVDWTVVRRNVGVKSGIATHVLLLTDINGRAKRAANSLLCGTQIGTTGVAHVGAAAEITCAECLAFLNRGKRTQTQRDLLKEVHGLVIDKKTQKETAARERNELLIQQRAAAKLNRSQNAGAVNP